MFEIYLFLYQNDKKKKKREEKKEKRKKEISLFTKEIVP